MKPQPSQVLCRSMGWLSVGVLAFACIRPGPRADDPPTSELSVHILDWEGTRERIQSEHQGRVVVVNLWTNTCPACLEGFPEFAGLLDRFDPDEFACVSLNCDYDGVPGKPPEYYRPRVIEFLQRQRNGIDHVMLSVALIDFLDEVELNSTPALFLFNQHGKLVRRFDNDQAETAADEFTMAQVEAAVRELLESPE